MAFIACLDSASSQLLIEVRSAGGRARPALPESAACCGRSRCLPSSGRWVDPFAGQYIRISDDDPGSAGEILVTSIPGRPGGPSRYAITGDAYWGALRELGPNIGQLAFVGTAEDGVIEYTSWLPFLEDSHRVRLTFRGVRLTVEEVNWIGVHGMGVTFQGAYERSA